jgi:hypothetical protein
METLQGRRISATFRLVAPARRAVMKDFQYAGFTFFPQVARSMLRPSQFMHVPCIRSQPHTGHAPGEP